MSKEDDSFTGGVSDEALAAIDLDAIFNRPGICATRTTGTPITVTPVKEEAKNEKKETAENQSREGEGVFNPLLANQAVLLQRLIDDFLVHYADARGISCIEKSEHDIEVFLGEVDDKALLVKIRHSGRSSGGNGPSMNTIYLAPATEHGKSSTSLDLVEYEAHMSDQVNIKFLRKQIHQVVQDFFENKRFARSSYVNIQLASSRRQTLFKADREPTSSGTGGSISQETEYIYSQSQPDGL